MADQLIDGLAADWNPDKYHDTYVEELRKRIKAKRAGKEIVDEPVTTETPANVLDLDGRAPSQPRHGEAAAEAAQDDSKRHARAA